jgi:glyoxalase family protein
MEEKINGLHHITVLASDPQKNYDFYTKIMGLRFVKKTVNFDAPDVYHFYFADEQGTPGTILTFFPFPMAKRGTRGNGEATIVSFAIPKGSLEFWTKYLESAQIRFDGPDNKMDHNYISLLDPDGMKIELVEDAVEHLKGWKTGQIPREHSIRKFFSTTLNLQAEAGTELLITKVMGFSLLKEQDNIKRYQSGSGDQQAFLDIIVNKELNNAIQSAGSVHHIAWRTESDESQRMWIKRLRENGLQVTDVIDRNYFYSIYFREPGGVLFEIATDHPGFMVDEDLQHLGQALKLPEQYEAKRDQIEKILTPINT